MDRFIARENIKHFREMLHSELRPEDRARVGKLLVEERGQTRQELGTA